MTRTDFDDRLAALASPLPESVRAEARRVASASMPRRLRRGRAPRARWVVPVIVSGALALTAGAGSVGIAMSHWSGVEILTGNIRNEAPIPVEWVTDAGETNECRAWIEVRNPARGDQAALDDAVIAHDWSGMGQRLYDQASSGEGDREQWSDAFTDALGREMRAFAEEAFPGIHWFAGRAGERAVDAWGETCVPEADR